jgi:N-acyl-D-aspartate/D-glutamate deacylase
MPTDDLFIRNGRVIDPETGFDKICDVAIRRGRIVAIGTGASNTERSIDASGLVVAPGFIDLHAHGQSLPADRMQAFDGVTTTLELEAGALPVSDWYKQHAAAGRTLNYGCSVNWINARIAVMNRVQPEASLSFMAKHANSPRWANEIATDQEVAGILDYIRQGLNEGALGIGLLNAYAPGSGVKEMTEVCALAAEHAVPTYTHIAYMSNVDPRSSIEAYTRLIGYAASTGAHMHICHFNSTSVMDVERAAQLVQHAQKMGLKVTVEAYPYGTGSTLLSATFFSDPDFARRTGRDWSALQMVDTGRRFQKHDEVLRAQAQDPGALVLWHFLDVEANQRHRDLLDVSVLFPGGAIASDAMPWTRPDGSIYEGDVWPLPDGTSSHPRSAGTFTRFLRQWVHERQTMSLIDGLRKCTLIPAQIMQASAPQFAKKGRLQVGCDADIVVFDWDRLTDRADFKAMNRAAEGVRHLLVNGEAVIADGALQTAACPGRPLRRTPAA